ncbi:hypothetical protein SAMN05444422_101738 [Halobiforma haloterrestris]|uniref:Uncharacterized protein n=1 Tax=Natronobacterium haloterrestre TaxID=148448 RepID=A0A1I1DRI2_NATHA|nr:hypothetical protein [Halobiforma haloterrestris]SFB75300.1 hypothetical protein SAMN05444422_101738 [Halobiforma haloterrestris]
MSGQPTSLLERFRNPEYTGDNRCLPCTAVNIVIAAVASALLAVVSAGVGAVAFVASLLAIYLRGYLVPGTPTLTKRYFPDRVLALFDKGPHPVEETRAANASTASGGTESGNGSPVENAAAESDAGDPDDEEWETLEELERHREEAVDPETFLLEVDVVEPCEDADDLCLTDGFADRLEGAIDRHADHVGDPDPAAVADLFGAESAAVEVKDREYPAIEVGRRIHKWPGDAALIADLATHEALDAWTDRWETVPRGQRVELLEALRSFHDACPQCGGAIELNDETVESCCRAYEVLALGCRDCGEPLLEFDPTEIRGQDSDGGVQP